MSNSTKQQRLSLLQQQQASLQAEINEEAKQEQNFKNNLQPNIDEIKKYITSDSLGYLSMDGVMKAVETAKHVNGKENFCKACFTGNYPVELTDQKAKSKQLRLFGS